MKLVIWPSVDERRSEAIQAAVRGEVLNAAGEDEALAGIEDADAFFGKVTPSLLGAARRLRWIQSPTASLEHYLFPDLIRHPAVLTNMRGIFSDVIADHVLGYVLCFARNLHLYVRRQLEARWDPAGGEASRCSLTEGQARVTAMDLAVTDLSSSTLGIIGLGAVGREIARRAAGFGMGLLAVDPCVEESALRDARALPESLSEVWPVSRLDDLLAASDFVCIAAPHTPFTEGMVRRSRLRRMRPEARLINVGRGAIVVLDDLVAALEAGEIAGAALDVFEVEPLPAEHPLWRMENVIITPHVASCSPEVPERHLRVLLENLERFQDGRPLLNTVDKERWF